MALTVYKILGVKLEWTLKILNSYFKSDLLGLDYLCNFLKFYKIWFIDRIWFKSGLFMSLISLGLCYPRKPQKLMNKNISIIITSVNIEGPVVGVW
jgi:hypothetical protein